MILAEEEEQIAAEDGLDAPPTESLDDTPLAGLEKVKHELSLIDGPGVTADSRIISNSSVDLAVYHVIGGHSLKVTCKRHKKCILWINTRPGNRPLCA